MAVLTPLASDYNGVLFAAVAADVAGDTFANDGYTLFYIKNGAGAPITVTFKSQDKCSEGVEHDVAVTVTNGTEKVVGFFPKARFNNASGNIEVTYSAVATVTVKPVRVG